MQPIVRLGAPRHDCLEEKEEEGEAELLPRLDLLREVPVDGGERRRPRLAHGHGAILGLGFAAGKKEGERESRATWSFLSTRGERQGRAGSSGTVARRSVATAMALQREDDGVFAENPLPVFFPFSVFISLKDNSLF